MEKGFRGPGRVSSAGWALELNIPMASRLKIGFSFVPTSLNWLDLVNERGKRTRRTFEVSQIRQYDLVFTIIKTRLQTSKAIVNMVNF